MSRVSKVALVAFVGGVAATLLGGFLYSQHLERAAAWAGVIGLPIAIAGLVLAAIPLLQSRRSRTGESAGILRDGNQAARVSPEQKSPIQYNLASGGQIFAVQDGTQHINKHALPEVERPSPGHANEPQGHVE